MMNTKKKDPKGQTKQPLKCWLVEITLTSGEDLQFYVTAIDQFSAYKKADEYAIIAENKELRGFYNTGFKLLP